MFDTELIIGLPVADAKRRVKAEKQAFRWLRAGEMATMEMDEGRVNVEDKDAIVVKAWVG